MMQKIAYTFTTVLLSATTFKSATEPGFKYKYEIYANSFADYEKVATVKSSLIKTYDELTEKLETQYYEAIIGGNLDKFNAEIPLEKVFVTYESGIIVARIDSNSAGIKLASGDLNNFSCDTSVKTKFFFNDIIDKISSLF